MKKSKLEGAMWLIGGTAAGILAARALAPLADKIAAKVSPTSSTLGPSGSGITAPQITTAVYRRYVPAPQPTTQPQGTLV